jgi:hypothetical protein
MFIPLIVAIPQPEKLNLNPFQFFEFPKLIPLVRVQKLKLSYEQFTSIVSQFLGVQYIFKLCDFR